MGETKIEWTEATWNPVTGCTKVSPGCSRCYAEAIDHRFNHDKVGKLPWAFPASRGGRGVTLHPERLDLPLQWKRPRMIFVNSMSDLFHEDVPFEFIARVWDTMFTTLINGPGHIYQILTKRPDRMLAFSKWMNEHELRRIDYDNAWLGVSVENQLWAERRISILARISARVRFVSVEPMLGPVDLKPYFFQCSGCHQIPCACKGLAIQQVICGGESGPRFRPMNLDWARSLRDQCQTAGVPFFYKQSSGQRPGTGRELDGRLWEEFPITSGLRTSIIEPDFMKKR